MGFLIAALTIILFLIFLWRVLDIAAHVQDPFAKYVVVGIGAWIVIQAFVNIGSMVALMPITGVPLPFISYGGTSLAISMAGIGVILNISRHKK